MIVYFSGTGNSKYVAERLAAATNETAVSIEGLSADITLNDGERLGLAVPTYFWELPAIVREFLDKLTIKNAAGHYIYFVATYGTTSGCIGEDAKRMFKNRGIELNGLFGVKMPDNWTPVFDLSDPEKAAKQNATAENYINKAAELILKCENGYFMANKAPFFISKLTGALYEKERRAKKFYVEDSCIGCGLCAEKCPSQAIEMKEKKPVWIKECTLCLRCLHCCPKFAIQYGSGKTKQHGQYTNPNVKL